MKLIYDNNFPFLFEKALVLWCICYRAMRGI